MVTATFFNGGKSDMIYDVIIIGAGAAGLFAGASLPSPVNGLIIDRKAVPGKKLLLSGAGQCNLTHGGNIKEFISHYGENGGQIRSVLYRFNNHSVMDFFNKKGIPLFQREDGKVFPKSLQAQEVLDVLVRSCRENGLKFCFSAPVDQISISKPIQTEIDPLELDAPIYTIHCGDRSFQTKKLILATGGCSYPGTGSDGSLFPLISKLGIEVHPRSPSLVPIYVDQYPYKDLSGISFQNAVVSIGPDTNTTGASGAVKGKALHQNSDALLLTHNGFSGPAILNHSRYAHPGDILRINYIPSKSLERITSELSKALSGNNKQLLTLLYEYFNENSKESPAELPKRFLELICQRAGIDPSAKASQIPPSLLKKILSLIACDSYKITKLGGYETAMVTSGGVSLTEINLKTMESKKYPNLFFAGEMLDIDGDTGGYNLQFAFSSGNLAASNIK